jgi:hypothetical protein
MRVCPLMLLCAALLLAGDGTGVSPRANPSDYVAHGDAKTAVVAAAMVAPDQVKKIFSAVISKRYFVVEVAVFPNAGQSFDVDRLDFSLKAGDQVLRVSQPGSVVPDWPEKHDPMGNRGTHVGTEAGVIVEHGTDPVTGRPRTATGTYEGVSVSNYPRPDDPAPPRNDPDLTAIDDKVRQMALTEGAFTKPVAGYLYFRKPKGKASSFTLNYTGDNASVDLTFPEKTP